MVREQLHILTADQLLNQLLSINSSLYQITTPTGVIALQ